jgi:hypothetical protein
MLHQPSTPSTVGEPWVRLSPGTPVHEKAIVLNLQNVNLIRGNENGTKREVSQNE